MGWRSNGFQFWNDPYGGTVLQADKTYLNRSLMSSPVEPFLLREPSHFFRRITSIGWMWFSTVQLKADWAAGFTGRIQSYDQYKNDTSERMCLIRNTQHLNVWLTSLLRSNTFCQQNAWGGNTRKTKIMPERNNVPSTLFVAEMTTCEVVFRHSQREGRTRTA